jgi:hypothetical protein
MMEGYHMDKNSELPGRGMALSPILMVTTTIPFDSPGNY